MATTFTGTVVSGRKMDISYVVIVGCGELDIKVTALSYTDGSEMIKRDRASRGPSDTESAYRAALHHYFTNLTDD
jgi:hypothetical protein